MTSIETVTVYDQTGSKSISSSNWDSVTRLNLVRGDGDLTVTLGANVATVGLTDIVTSTAGLIIAADSTATSLTLETSKITDGGNTTDITVTGAALTTVTVNALTSTVTDLINLAGATSITLNATGKVTTTIATSGTATLTVTGAGAVDLGVLDADIDTVTATANTGGFTADLSSNTDTVINGSAGNDVITASTEDSLTTTMKLAVNAGEGTSDKLIVLAAADISSVADGAHYTGFEVLSVVDDIAVSNIAGITSVEVGTSTSKSITGLNATQAANIKAIGDLTTDTFALTTATGTTDVLSLTMGTGLTTAAATDIVTGVTVTGFETINIKENGGPTATAGADRTSVIAAFSTPTTLSAVNLTGRAVNISNVATTIAVAINGSALTGDGDTVSTGLTVAGSAVAGSTITGSAVRDDFTIGAEGSTYNGGAGDDKFTTTSTILLADGTTDATIVGGLGTDTLAISAASSLTDINFTNVSGMEKLVLIGGAANESVTGLAGSAKAAFADGITVTTASTLSDGQTFTWTSGIYDKAVNLTLVSSGDGATTADNIAITTGTANDTINVTAGSWVGAAATAGVYSISTGAGDDTIKITSGAILADGAISVTGGTGADKITATTSHAVTTGLGVVYNIASGDSTTTAYDVITGFDIGTGTTLSDSLNLDSTTVVSNTAATDGTNSGIILSHAITSGIITFDDNNTFTTAVVVNATNLSDVLAYLAANTSTNDTVAFTYDSDASGTADATFVYQNLASDVRIPPVVRVLQ